MDVKVHIFWIAIRGVRLPDRGFGSGRVGLQLYPKALKVRRYSFKSEISLALRFRQNITQNFLLILANRSLKGIIFLIEIVVNFLLFHLFFA